MNPKCRGKPTLREPIQQEGGDVGILLFLGLGDRNSGLKEVAGIFIIGDASQIPSCKTSVHSARVEFQELLCMVRYLTMIIRRTRARRLASYSSYQRGGRSSWAAMNDVKRAAYELPACSRIYDYRLGSFVESECYDHLAWCSELERRSTVESRDEDEPLLEGGRHFIEGIPKYGTRGVLHGSISEKWHLGD